MLKHPQGIGKLMNIDTADFLLLLPCLQPTGGLVRRGVVLAHINGLYFI